MTEENCKWMREFESVVVKKKGAVLKKYRSLNLKDQIKTFG
jgi:hypothetical protein